MEPATLNHTMIHNEKESESVKLKENEMKSLQYLPFLMLFILKMEVFLNFRYEKFRKLKDVFF
jgi:hypothetical protein